MSDTINISEHGGGPGFLCGSEVLRGEAIQTRTFDVWVRKYRHAKERFKVLMDDFYLVREDIVLGPFLPILEGRDLEGRE